MNGDAFSAEHAGKGSTGRAFARGLSEVFDRVGRLERFHGKHVRRIVSSVEAPGSTVPVPLYIDSAVRSQPSASAVFAALVMGTGVEASGTAGST